MRRFFEPFLFEDVPARDQRTDEIYLDELKKSEIYLGIFGYEYGYENSEGISPTEIEYVFASKHNKTRQ